MSKGNEPNPKHKKPVRTTREQKTSSTTTRNGGGGGGGGGGGQQTTSSTQCWPFELVRKTPAAQKATNGLSVYGSPDGEDLQVLTGQLGLLGFAPSGRARQIIRALNQRGGGSLSGNVVSKNGTDVRVEICLR